MHSDDNLSFENTEIAFAGRSDKDLNRAYWLFRFLNNNKFVRIGSALTNWALRHNLPIEGMVRKTVYKQFCGGETMNECQDTINLLSRYNIGTILDFSSEGHDDTEAFEFTQKEILQTVYRASLDKRIAFCVFKPTGLMRFGLLEKIDANQALTKVEQNEFKAAQQRIDLICHMCAEKGVSLFVDAEETWIQETIDDMILDMMRTYNKEKVIVYNTLQMYRTDRLDYLHKLAEDARKNGYKIGLKLVRGAYLEKERARAIEKGYTSPLHTSKEATDRDYDAAVRFCLENIDIISVCAGTHNEKSSMLMAEYIMEHKIQKNHPHLHFSQLLGMSDHISFNLASAGFNVSKYVPYGPIEAVIPYLIRRAQENTAVAGQMGRELQFIVREKARRKGKK
jgi:proline dehydrogenase